MPITCQAHMNPSHVVHRACTRDCSVEGYGGPQGPRKLLDNGDFGLLGSTKIQAHSFSSHMWVSKLDILQALPIICWKQAFFSTPYYPMEISHI